MMWPDSNHRARRELTVCNSARADSAALAIITRLVTHDDNFVVVSEELVSEALRGRRTRQAIAGSIGQRVSKVATNHNQSPFMNAAVHPERNILVKDTRSVTTIVVQEGQAISNSLLGAVVSLAAPATPASIHGRSITISAILVHIRDIHIGNVHVGGVGGVGDVRDRSRSRSGRSIIRGIRGTIPGVDPADFLTVDGGRDDITDSALLFLSGPSLDIADLLVASVEVLVAVTALVDGRLGITLDVAESRSRGVKGELLELHWATEMPRDLIPNKSIPVSSLSVFPISCVPHLPIKGPIQYSYLFVQRSQRTAVGLGGLLAVTTGHIGDGIVGALSAEVGVADGFDGRAVPVALDVLGGASGASLGGSAGDGGGNGRSESDGIAHGEIR